MKNHLNTNKMFMLGNGLLAFAVIAVVVIFLYMSFRLKREQDAQHQYAEVYDIVLTSGFKGDSLSVYVNDSLLHTGRVKADTLQLRAPRTADDNILVVENHDTDHTDYFNLKPEGGRVLLTREGELCKMRH